MLPGTLVGKGEDDYKRMLGEFLKVIELFLILKLIIQLYVFAKIHRIVH